MSVMKTIADYMQHKWDVVVTKGDRPAMQQRQHDRFMRNDPEYRRKHIYSRNLAQAMLSARSGRYRGSKADKASGGPAGPWSQGGAADTHVLGDWQPLAERTRQLMRDDPLANSIRQRFLKNVIGSGLRPQAKTGDAEVNQRLEKAFNRLSGNFDPSHRLLFAQLQKLTFSAGFFDGDTMLRKVIYPNNEDLQFELIEGDRVMTPLGVKPQDELGRIIQGVEKDRYGRIVAYFIRKEHPREAFTSPGAPPNASMGPEAFWRVTPDSVFRLWNPERPGQTRGVSQLHAVIKDIRDLDFLIEASLQRINISAALSVFITSPEPMDNLMGKNAMGSELADDTGDVIDTILEPGGMFHLLPGEKVSTLVPNFPTPELMPFVKAIAMRIASALGITWEEVLGDYSQDNYSTARVALLDSRLTYTWLQEWFTSSILTPMWVSVHEHQRLRDPMTYQGVSPEDIQKVEWTGPGWAWVDPLKEAKADVEALRGGISSLSEILSRRGIDWQEHLEQLALERKKKKELGLDDLEEKPADNSKSIAQEVARAVEDALLVAG